LLLDAAVDLHRKYDGIRRGDKGVLADRVQDLTDRDLARQGPAVIDYRFSVAIPAVDWRASDRSAEESRSLWPGSKLTLDAPAALEQGADVAFDGAVADKLMA
jgi:hypothetical protein